MAVTTGEFESWVSDASISEYRKNPGQLTEKQAIKGAEYQNGRYAELKSRPFKKPAKQEYKPALMSGGMDVAVAPITEQEVVYKKPKNLFDKIVVFSFSSITFAMSFVLTLLIVIATFLRYVLQVDLYGYEEWVKLFAFWLYFSGAALGAFNGTHVSADLVHSYVPDGVLKRFLVFLKDLVTVVVSGLFVWYGYEFFWFGFRGPLGTGVALPMTTAWRIPFWTSYLAVFIGLVFMFCYFARDLCKSTRELVAGGCK